MFFKSDKNSGCCGNVVSINLIVGKVKIGIFSVSVGIFDFFLQKCLLSSLLCFIRLSSKSLIFNWLLGRHKG